MKILLLIIIGLILLILGIILYIIFKVKSTLGDYNYGLILEAFKNAVELKKEEYSKVRQVSGMTSLCLERIRKDFPDFNEHMLFNKLEGDLRSIFDAKTRRDLADLDSDTLRLVRGNVKKEIDDLIENDNKVKYTDVVFNNHAIRSYEKRNGTSTITMTSSVNYYFDSTDKNIEKYKDVKKGSLFVTKYIYVYDEDKFDKNVTSFIVRCPNCGAPLKMSGEGNCEYCSSYVKPINVKTWLMSSYKED